MTRLRGRIRLSYSEEALYVLYMFHTAASPTFAISVTMLRKWITKFHDSKEKCELRPLHSHVAGKY